MGESAESFWNPGDSRTSGAMTERLYYRDSFLREFEAQVVSAEAVAGKWHVQLDRTAFYPTSGGQPNDLGRAQTPLKADVARCAAACDQNGAPSRWRRAPVLQRQVRR